MIGNFGGWASSKMSVVSLVTDGVTDFVHVDTKFFWWRHGQKWVWPVWSWDTKIDCISRMKRWNRLIFLHAGTNPGNLRVDSMIFGRECSKMAMAYKFMTP